MPTWNTSTPILLQRHTLPKGQSYAQANRHEHKLTVLGYDHYDKRSFELEDGTEGFRTGYLHLVGFDYASFFTTKVGLGNLAYATELYEVLKTAWFEQADLRDWAGSRADFSYLFFVTNGIGFAVQPRGGQLLSYSAKILQARTIGGDIYFAGDDEGDFVAIWESIEGDVEFSLLEPYDNLRLGLRASVYRQRLSANMGTRKKFSQRRSGNRVTGHVAFYFD